MYLWQLLGHDSSEGALCSGIGQDVAAIMRLIEGYLTDAKGLAGHVVQVVPRMSVFHLDVIHVPTGREWRSFRDKDGWIYWEERYHPADPDLVYTAPESRDQGTAAS